MDNAIATMHVAKLQDRNGCQTIRCRRAVCFYLVRAVIAKFVLVLEYDYVYDIDDEQFTY